ncbi:MAG: flagellin, partial [Hylemonella sp.]|nr:flagellin [Hylemonella sp.]
TLGALTNSTATGLADIAYSYDISNSALDSTTVTDLTSIAAGTLTITVGAAAAIDLGEIRPASSGSERLGQVVEAINRKSTDTGVTAYLTKNNDGTYAMEMYSSKLDINGDPEAVAFAGFTATTTGIVGYTAVPINAIDTTTDAVGIDTLSVETQGQSWVALKKIDTAIDQINHARAELGALQSRFESAVNNIDIQVENMAAARGRIVDADFAKETANLSRTQILQQAGTAMVAQANQLPQGVLALLRQ